MDKIPVRHITTTQKEPELSESFSIRDIHDMLEGKDMVQELHRHDFFLMLALKKGEGSHDIDFTHYAIGDNSVFFMRPGQVHRLELRAGSTGYLMQFRNEFDPVNDKTINHLLRKAAGINHYRFDDDGFKRLLSTLAYIFQEYTGKQDQFREVIKANMRIIFIELSREHANNSSDYVALYMQGQLEKFLELLETDVFKHKQVTHYAETLNLSAFQLNTITKAMLGKTSSELIDEYIILEAKRYLLATANQVNQVAYHLGYEDVSYFIRFFKKHTGHSPEAFRHNFS